MPEPLREPLIDSHAHLFFPDFEGMLPEVMMRAAEAGVTDIVNVGTKPEDNGVGIALVREIRAALAVGPQPDTAGGPEPHWPRLYTTVGFHPHEAQHVGDDQWPTLELQAAEPEVVALGEFGLDYHYEHSPRDAQRRVFRRGIELALRTRLPMVIHSRKAGLEAVELLDDVAGREAMPAGVFHCFTDTLELAEAALERGFSIGITGIVTFKKADAVREVARRVPLERLLVETDAPFCAPEPVRGHTNEPAYVTHVADRLAELHGVDPAELRRRTTANARALFGLAGE